MVKICGNGLNPLPLIQDKNGLNLTCHKKEIQVLRDLTRESLKEIELDKETKQEELYIKKSADLFKTIAKGMEQYLAGLYKRAEGIIDAPPYRPTFICYL